MTNSFFMHSYRSTEHLPNNMAFKMQSKGMTENIKTEEKKATLHDIKENMQVGWGGIRSSYKYKEHNVIYFKKH